MTIRAVYLDIEGTVYPGRDHGFSIPHMEKSQDIAKMLFEQNVAARFVTGRPAAYVEAVGQIVFGSLMDTDYVGTDIFPSVCEGGGVLFYHFDKRGEDVLQDRQSIRKLRDLEDELYDRLPGIVFEPGKDTMFSVNPPADMDIENFYDRVIETILESGTIVQDKYGAYRHKEFDVTPKNGPETHIQVTHSVSAVDVTRGGIDKGSGLLRALKVSRTKPEETLVIGDSWNDKPAMEAVGHVGIVGNARDDFKDWGKERGVTIAKKPHIYGVEEILEVVL